MHKHHLTMPLGVSPFSVACNACSSNVCSVCACMLNKFMKQTLSKTSQLVVYSCRGVINRYGFNNEGVDAASQRLDSIRQQSMVGPSKPEVPKGLIGVNLGKNKTSEDAGADYSIGVSKLGQFADYLVINISSPNTPGTLTSLCIDNRLQT